MAGCCTQDVTGSEPSTSEAAMTPMTEDTGTQTTSSMQTVGLDITDAPIADSSQPPENNQTQTDLPALTTLMVRPSNVPVTVSEETITTNQDVASPEPSIGGSVDGTTSTVLPETITSSTTIRLTEKPISTSSITGTINVEHSTAGNLNSSSMTTATRLNSSIDSTTTVPSTTNAETTTRRPTRSPRTTTQRRTTTTTMAYHECVTSATCLDPNAHCVNLGGHNTCECRTGFRKSSPIGRCELIAISSTTTIVPSTVTLSQENATVMTSQSQNVTSSSWESSSNVPPLPPAKIRVSSFFLH